MDLLPSPAETPPLHSSDSSPQASRKRQRSRSMQSNNSSSSSSKRPASDVGHEVTTRSSMENEISMLSPPKYNRFDASMAEHGELDIETMSLAAELPGTAPSYSSTSGETKIREFNACNAVPMESGQTWYLAEILWMKRWRKACSGVIDKDITIKEEDLGPVNNASLVDREDRLKKNITEGYDFEYVSESAWLLLVRWYGIPSTIIPRQTIEVGDAVKQVKIEMYPLRLKALRLTKRNLPSFAGSTYITLSISSQDTLIEMCKRLAYDLFGSIATLPYRVWKVDSQKSSKYFDRPEFPFSKLADTHPILIDQKSAKTVEDSEIEDEDTFVVEFEDQSGWLTVLPQTNPSASKPLFNSNDGFFNRMSSSSSSSIVTHPKSEGNAVDPIRRPVLTYSAKPIDAGTLGLGNMGNTCFMNSALQCLAHQKELSEYFLSGVFQDELNPDNPLGMRGELAEAFGDLLTRIWSTTSSSTSYSPREFKSVLQRFAPQFHGYQQHDSQELVAFLLDGLHEDLNRVLKKPYVEKPDWEGGGDTELVGLAIKSWEGYMQRNDSIIVDLFQGQYQSTLVCPECSKVSITFDPFMYLTLPLPVVKKWRGSVYYIPWDHTKPHQKVQVETNRDASFKELRQLLGRWMDAEPDNLLTMEIFSSRFYKALDDNVLCGDMNDSDIIVCYELPCHAQQSRTYKDKKRPDDPFIIPVYLCDVSNRSNTYRTPSVTPFGHPIIAVIDREAARSVSGIYASVIHQLQRWTHQPEELFKWEPSDRSYSPVSIPINETPIIDNLTEINEAGDIITVRRPTPEEEGDITDEKGAVIADVEHEEPPSSATPVKVGPKDAIFTLEVQGNAHGFTQYGSSSAPRFDPWTKRVEEATAEDGSVLLRAEDILYCEFDENIKEYYLADNDEALWKSWEPFIHPEYAAGVKAAAAKEKQAISLQDCLDEFTKEEQLSEDDLWYCPNCKKHQQATKKFDLWKAPDILVVHLKRFSNSRTLRDKIDSLVEFPIQGFDLGDMIGERQAAKRLAEQSILPETFGIMNHDQPLVYDLFAVDEHMGGLGGGHYRAYAYNHKMDKWYHFDDSHVSPADPEDSVNPNAYLLFYRRRTPEPLGGVSYEKVEEARLKSQARESEASYSAHEQLPTPPNESIVSTDSDLLLASWVPFEKAEPPLDQLTSFETIDSPRRMLGMHSPSAARTSPSSSNEAVDDPDTDLDLDDDDPDYYNVPNLGSPRGESPSESWAQSPISGIGSPSSSSSELNPFCDANATKDESIGSQSSTR